MKTVYAIAYMTEGEDGVKDLYVETIIADSRETALGVSMLDYMGAEIQGRGDKIVMVNVAEQDIDDLKSMFGADEEKQKIRKALVAINNLCGQDGSEFANKVFALCKDY